jgi:hypothetical protein
MKKRGLTIGTYDTAATGRWTLTGWEFSPAVQYTNFVEVPGRRKGPLDLSTALTDGEPIYGSRTLTATFENSEGNRLDREARISEMVNSLDGFIHEITLPDDTEHYIVGRVHIERLYNDTAHCSVHLTATCEPWRYNIAETRISLAASATDQTATLPNLGRLAVTPQVTVTGTEVVVEYGGNSWALNAGTYTLPDLLIPSGGLTVKYRGSGGLVFDYREAVL